MHTQSVSSSLYHSRELAGFAVTMRKRDKTSTAQASSRRMRYPEPLPSAGQLCDWWLQSDETGKPELTTPKDSNRCQLKSNEQPEEEHQVPPPHRNI
ncbi:hypothetical protein DTO164E3_104 [Paecilomyces variotii]|nr:hypothetical protein DTO164E3_104 [Paecilomyces variotii]KAJ9381625.1 hypothetical protein DTO063F5_6061 [Paecilomyces variotii]KAJ9408174.1 hypothetical protein DTO045G8_4031 [Paecilomyces variotii]